MNRMKNLLIKVLSLGIGLAAGIVLIAKVCFELSYDTAYPGVEQLYRIRCGIERASGDSADYEQVSGAVAPGFKAEVPGVVEATRTTVLFDSNCFVDEQGNRIEGTMRLADSCFFRVFERPVLAGDPARALAKWSTAAVSRSFAEKLGGVEEAIGQTVWNEDLEQLKITIEAVYEDFPPNGSFDYDLLLSMETYSRSSTENWVGNDRYIGYVKLAPGVDPHTLDEAIHKMQAAHQPFDAFAENGLQLWYYLEPFDRMHTSDPQVHTMIVLLSVVAFLLIFISLLNYVLIVISSMVKRSREMGVRKCYGAGRTDIYRLLIREAVCHLGLALLLATAMIFAARGVIANLLGVDFAMLLIPQSVCAICVVVLLVLAVSIVVPAQLYLRVPVHAALKNFTDHSRRWKIALLGVQVLINVFLVVMMLVIAAQYRFLLNDDPGYDYRNLYFVVDSGYNQADAANRERLRNALLQLPEVEGVEAASGLPFEGSSGDNILDADGRELFNVADNYEATAGFYDLLRIPFVEGRAPQTHTECAVDETFVAKMNEFADWSDGAVGKTIRITGHGGRVEFTVAGVYRNILTGNRLATDARPGIRFYGELQDSISFLPNLLFRVTRSDGDLMRRLNEAVAGAADGKSIEVFSYADRLRADYDDNRKMRNTIFVGSLLALLIALLGLLGFLRDETQRRSKEIAIRKINGASVRDILGLLARDMLRLSLAMAVGGCAAAAWTAHRWLAQFAVRVPVSFGYFVLATAAVLAVVGCVVVLNCWRIATANPVKSLKNE